MLRMAVATGTAAMAIRSKMKDTPAGARMHDALVHPEGRGPRGFRETLIVVAEVESWEALLAWARERGRTHPREAHDRVLLAKRAAHLGDRVEKELDKLAKHPAYRNLMIDGTDTVHLPARRKVGDDRWWPSERMAEASPRGDPGTMERAELVPHRVQRSSRVFTAWSATP